MNAGDPLDDGATALRNRPIPRLPLGLRRPASGRSIEPHHRRRRATALAIVAGLALLVGVLVGAGGGNGARHHPHPPSGFFARVQTLAGDNAGSFAYAQQAAENSAIDRTLALTPYVRVAGAQHREIALTFDDGPGPFTPKVLSTLERESAPATFFEVGALERYFHDSTAAIVAKGFPIGDHTEAHAPMAKLSARDQQAQVLRQTSAVGAYNAPFPRMFRPPYGSWDNTTLRILRKYRMLMVLWTVDTSDYRMPGVTAIVDRAVSGARPGAIILMHDGGGNRSETVAALPRIIARLRAKGYQLVTVPRLLLDNPAQADQSIPASLVGAGR